MENVLVVNRLRMVWQRSPFVKDSCIAVSQMCAKDGSLLHLGAQ